jgi:nucleoside-diphosphate-sugar epimerase
LTDWIGKRVLVTGATGFIGQHLVASLIDAGTRVWGGIYPTDQPEREAVLPPSTLRVPLDVRAATSVEQAVEASDPDIVFHLAAVGVTDPTVSALEALSVNVQGTVHLLESARGRDIERIVLLGTCHEYGARETPEGLDPGNFYAASKLASWAFARAYWRAFGAPVVVGRPFQVYGPRQPRKTLIPAAIHAALAGEDFRMTEGKQRRDFIYISDLATASDAIGQSLDLGTGQTVTVREVVERIWAIMEPRGRILTGALPYRSGGAVHLVADADRTAQLIGWRARVGLEHGLRNTISHIDHIDMNAGGK